MSNARELAKVSRYTPVNKAGDTLTGALNETAAVTIASASTVAIGAAAANTISISGTTTITAFDTIAAGAVRRLMFAGALTLTHNATSLILPGGANITTAAGDAAEFVSLGSGYWRCINYTKASGVAVVSSGGADIQNFASTGTWTKPAGKTWAIIRLWGAGGGSSRNSTANNSPGGGGGAYNELQVPLANLGATMTVTVGAGGAAATSNAATATSGGNTTVTIATALFGKTVFTAFGGGGGGWSSTIALGGGGGGTRSAASSINQGGLGYSGPSGSSGGILYPDAGGEGSDSACSNGQHGFWGGGGGGSGTRVPAFSTYGGGGGAAGGSATQALSLYGGNGGPRGNGSAANGVVPGGGGGASASASTTGGAGANGYATIICW